MFDGWMNNCIVYSKNWVKNFYMNLRHLLFLWISIWFFKFFTATYSVVIAMTYISWYVCVKIELGNGVALLRLFHRSDLLIICIHNTSSFRMYSSKIYSLRYYFILCIFFIFSDHVLQFICSTDRICIACADFILKYRYICVCVVKRVSQICSTNFPMWYRFIVLRVVHTKIQQKSILTYEMFGFKKFKFSSQLRRDQWITNSLEIHLYWLYRLWFLRIFIFLLNLIHIFLFQINTTLFKCTWKKCNVIHKTVDEIENHVREAHLG